MVCVADIYNFRVQKFTSEGEFVAVIDGKETEVKEIESKDDIELSSMGWEVSDNKDSQSDGEDSIFYGIYILQNIFAQTAMTTFVSDAETINMYDSDGKFLGLAVSNTNGESNSKPIYLTGIAVDASGVIHIGKTTRISVY